MIQKYIYKIPDVILYTNENNWERTLLNAERVSQRPRSKKLLREREKERGREREREGERERGERENQY